MVSVLAVPSVFQSQVLVCVVTGILWGTTRLDLSCFTHVIYCVYSLAKTWEGLPRNRRVGGTTNVPSSFDFETLETLEKE